MSTPILPFAVWLSGTNQNSIPANDNSRRNEILNGLVISDAVTAQPGSPVDGDIYILPSTHTGAQWATFDDDDLVIFSGGTWYAFTPIEGVRVNLAGAEYEFTGSGGWAAFGGGGGAVSDGDYGDITVSGAGSAWAIDAGVVTFAKLASAAVDTDGTLAANSATKLPTQSAVKTYVDSLVQGLSWKKAVRAATTANGTLATAYENGDAIDGVTLATGDRILLKNQSTGSENGIYTVNASGAPTRVTDADTGAELVNATVYVSEGTTLADTQWTCSTNGPITVGSTSLAFAQLSSGGGGMTNPMTTTGDIIYSSSGSTPARLGVGSNGNVLTLASGVPSWAAPSGGGLTGFTSTLETASPNNTNNASLLIASGGTTNQNFVASPKAQGAFQLQLADSTTTGGNVRGINAVDLQMSRTNANQVASASNSAIVGGTRNRASAQSAACVGGITNLASGTNAFTGGGDGNTASNSQTAAFGNGNTASGDSAFATGSGSVASGDYSAVFGALSTADAQTAFAIGASSTARGTVNAFAHGAGPLGGAGAQQYRHVTQRGSTTSATPLEITADAAAGGTANRIILPTSATYHITATLVARQTVTGDSKSFTIKALAKNIAGTVTIVGQSTTVEFADAGAATWTASLSVSGTAVLFNVTGEAAKNLRWLARSVLTEIVY